MFIIATTVSYPLFIIATTVSLVSVIATAGRLKLHQGSQDVLC